MEVKVINNYIKIKSNIEIREKKDKEGRVRGIDE